jgi:hypothetical protein
MPLMYFCVEECCTDAPLFCRECDEGMHFLHKTNELLVLFFDPFKIHYESLIVGNLYDLLLSNKTVFN